MPKLRYAKNNYTITLPASHVQRFGWVQGDDLMVTADHTNHTFTVTHFKKQHQAKYEQKKKQREELEKCNALHNPRNSDASEKSPVGDNSEPKEPHWSDRIKW